MCEICVHSTGVHSAFLLFVVALCIFSWAQRALALHVLLPGGGYPYEDRHETRLSMVLVWWCVYKRIARVHSD